MCVAADRTIQLFKEIVVEVKEPLGVQAMAMEPVFVNWDGVIGYCNEVEYNNRWGPWYGDIDEDESEAEYNDLGYVDYDWTGLGYDEMEGLIGNHVVVHDISQKKRCGVTAWERSGVRQPFLQKSKSRGSKVSPPKKKKSL
jgi:hypothetical protein